MEVARSPPAAPSNCIRVLFCCDPGYYQHLAVALTSLLESNSQHFLEIHLITGDRDAAIERKLSTSISPHGNFSLTIHQFAWANKSTWHTSGHITSETYTRIFAPHVLDDSIEKILYLDADLVVINDLLPLWQMDIDDYALAAVPDPYGMFRRSALGIPLQAPYVNAGVLLLNIRRWRSDNLPARLAEYIEREGDHLMFHDQDAINAVLYFATKPLDYRWNVQARMLRPPRAPLPDGAAIRAAARSPAIIHYTTGRKPWMFVMTMPGKRIYRRYLRMTEWRGAPPLGRKWSNVPEYVANLILYLANTDYTLNDLLRTTRVGQFVDRFARRIANLTRDAWRGAERRPLTFK